MAENKIEKLIVKTEEDALALLAKSLEGKMPDNAQVEFEGWPIFKLSIYGDDFHGTIPTRIMPPILELQAEIHRVYCRAKYGDDSLRRLTNEEREALELVVEINDGCTEFIAEIGKALNEAIKSTNMTGTETSIVLISVGLMLTGSLAWKQWLASRKEMHKIDAEIKRTEADVKKHEVLAEAMASRPVLIETQKGFTEFRTNLAKKLKASDQVKVDDEPIFNGVDAAEIVPAPKVEAEAIRIDGDFIISEVKFPKANDFGKPYRLSVERISDNLKLTIDASHDKLSPAQVKVMEKSGFQLKVVTLQINAKKLRGKITRSELYSIEWPEDE